MTVKVGDKAPLFQAETDGEKISFGDLIGKKNIVLYFYPKDNTRGCTAEACGFRDNWDKILSLDAIVIGVSSQSVESHKEFKARNKIPFTLVSDPKSEIRKLYGATGFMIPPRVTFVIDKEGIIQFIFNSQLNIGNHIDKTLEILKGLEKENSDPNKSLGKV